MTPIRFYHKARHRLFRELRHAFAHARARVVDTEPTGEDLAAAWRDLPPNANAHRCVTEWLAAPPLPLASDIQDSPGIIVEADALLLGNARIFEEPCSLNLTGLWSRDPSTGAAWPTDTHFTRFKVFHPAFDGATDIRRLWEVGRFGWALPLARAWHVTGREEYATAWARFAEDFIARNPPEFGPHWLNAMEVALRAAHWCRALALFAARPGFTGLAPLLGKALPSLLAHGRYIRSHLEWTPYGRTNHFLADLAGLFFLSAFLPQLREADDWRKSSLCALLHEMEVQTDTDGFHAEASTAYHHFVLELYGLVAQAADARGLPMPESFHRCLARLSQADAALRGPEDLDPRIGDDDSGTVGLKKLEAGSWKLEVGGARADPDLSRPQATSHKPQEKGAGGKPVSPAREGGGRFESHASVAMKASGVYVLRSARLSCHVTCGPNGQQGVGGHAHNDKLALVLRVDGRPMVVERGTWGYSADPRTRDLFRSTAMHSTLAIDGLEQSRMKDWRMLRDEARARCVVWRDSDTETVFCGVHHGFLPLKARHRRTLQLDKRRHRLFVVDEAEAEGSHEVTLRLHLDPSLGTASLQVRKNRVDIPGGFFLFEEGSAPEVIEVPHSPVYGARVPALALMLRFPMTGRWQTSWEFTPTS